MPHHRLTGGGGATAVTFSVFVAVFGGAGNREDIMPTISSRALPSQEHVGPCVGGGIGLSGLSAARTKRGAGATRGGAFGCADRKGHHSYSGVHDKNKNQVHSSREIQGFVETCLCKL